MAAMNAGLLIFDANERANYCNPRVGEMLHMEPDTIVGRPAGTLLDALSPAIHDPEWRGHWRRSIASAPTGFDVTASFPGRPSVHLRVDTFMVEQPDGGKPITALLLRDVTSTSLVAGAHERERIAMDLHDGAVQSLYSVVLGLGTIELDLADRPEAEHWLAGARQARTRIGDIISDIRAYASRLRLGMSGSRDLRSGLSTVAAEVAMSGLITPELDFDAGAAALVPSHAAESLLLIAHEATSNVIRHSGATRVAIHWERMNGSCTLTVQDDGRGFNPRTTDRPAGDGLRNMHERAAALSGRLSLKSEPGSGTEVRFEIPVERLVGAAP